MRPSETASQQAVAPVTVLRTVGEATIRNRDYGDAPYLIPGLLYFGATVIYADGGLGKTVFAHALEQHLAYGRPFGGWVTDERTRCLTVSLEDDERQVGERSFRLMPSGALDTDGHQDVTEAADWHDMIEHAFYVAGDTFERRLDNLRLHLIAEAEAGRPFGYVRIDTYGDFVGGKPRDTNAYEWDKHCTTRMNKLALEFGIALVLIHHTNKKGEFSGSEGLRGGVTTLAVLERSTEQPDTEASLRSLKCRVAPEFAYALAKTESGVWEFTEDVRPTEVELQGMSRGAFGIISRGGAMTRQEIAKQFAGSAVNQNSLQVCLSRLKRKGILAFTQGKWSVAQPRADEGRLPRACRANCGEPLLEDLYGDGYHATCAPTRPEPSPAPTPPGEGSGAPVAVQTALGDDVQEEEQPPAPTVPPGVFICGPREISEGDARVVRGFSEDLEQLQAEREFFGDAAARKSSQGAYKLMRASIEGSRMKPLPNVPKEPRETLRHLGVRTEEPWTLVTERMDGRHRWVADDLPEDGWVTALDRTGSFPSACSSVPVAPNSLHHITEAEQLREAARKTLAGIWRILVPAWTDERIGHPLGMLAHEGPGAEVWVTSSHLEHLDKLGRQGRIEHPVTVLEGWAGRRSTSLFERFSDGVRKIYALPASEERTNGKRGASQAIRALWTKSEEVRSPWHRPDWNVGIRAESAVRHWIRADQAAAAGARVLALGATDETIVWTPDKPHAGWVPQPYIKGTKFGEVKIKPAFKGAPEGPAPLTEWKETLRGHRTR